uniref:Uncharacterized protein LOC111100657 n=1 Tax=Crassostrea virginica TaxID=6565 RepID=A0A8B8AAG4_CRAVI|nr:uncharacterized protein LOC111100657 [Crassostrea virginica]
MYKLRKCSNHKELKSPVHANRLKPYDDPEHRPSLNAPPQNEPRDERHVPLQQRLIQHQPNNHQHLHRLNQPQPPPPQTSQVHRPQNKETTLQPNNPNDQYYVEKLLRYKSRDETIWVCHGGNPGRSVNGNGKADRGACASMCKELWISKRHLLAIGAGGDLSSFQCIAAADKNTCMDFESCSTQSSSCGPSQLVSSAESSLFLLSQQSSQDWFELNKSPREKLNEALHDLSSKEFVPIASQVRALRGKI